MLDEFMKQSSTCILSCQLVDANNSDIYNMTHQDGKQTTVNLATKVLHVHDGHTHTKFQSVVVETSVPTSSCVHASSDTCQYLQVDE